MTREDTDRLFELLSIYRPNDPHAQDKTLRSAWALVLEPYAPEDVRVAVAEYFRESKYWPDVTDIASRCPQPKEAPEPERWQWPGWQANGYRNEADYREKMNKILDEARRCT